jgi:Flp pilus assembly pilin Flp
LLDSLHPSFATGARLRAVLNVNNSWPVGPKNFPNIRIRRVYQCFSPARQNRLVLAYLLHPMRRTRNVAVIGRKRSLRFPEMTPAFLVRSISPNQVRKCGPQIQLEKHKEQIMKMIKNFLKDESGMETLEYAVIAGLIAVAAALIYASGGTWATTIKNRLQNAAAQS